MSKKNALGLEKVTYNTLVAYIDVGQLPPNKATKLVDDFKTINAEVLKTLESEGNRILFVPVRPNSNTRLEVLPL